MSLIVSFLRINLIKPNSPTVTPAPVVPLPKIPVIDKVKEAKQR